MGIVYLIQPTELVGTDRYKIGCSTKSDLSRITTGYNKGTIPNIIEVVDDPYFVETLLKQAFSQQFTLIGGREFFSGNIHQMEACFKETTSLTKPSKIKTENDNSNVEKETVKDTVDNDSLTNKKRFVCGKCNKGLSSNQQLKLHMNKCNGLHPLQCPICLKMFASRHGKYEHKKYVKCKPPPQNNISTTTN